MARPKARGAREPKTKTVVVATAGGGANAGSAPRPRKLGTSLDPDRSLDPSCVSGWYEVMAPAWSLITDVLGGTRTMRQAGERRLPKHPGETQESYDRRTEQAVLFNVLALTVNTLAGYPFSEPIVLMDDVPMPIKDMAEDIDMAGTHIDVYAKEWFIWSLAKSFCHTLVDFPRALARTDGLARTLEDDRRDGLRPYWTMIQPEDLIAARSAVISGQEVIVHIRYRQCVTAYKGFDESSIVQIHVREPGRHQVWEEREVLGKTQWTLTDQWPVTLPGGKPAPVTLVTMYTNRDGFMIGKPPLEDLAHLNVTHWQSFSDQRNILSVARFPMLAASGVEDDEGEQEVGPNQFLSSPNADAKFYYVEHTGAAISSGSQDIKDLEDRMAAYGADFLKDRPTVYTATGRVLDQVGLLSPLQTMTISARDSLEKALEYTALWMGLEDGGSVKLNTEFGPQPVDSADMQALLTSWEQGAIDDETLIRELQRRKTLAPDIDVVALVKGIPGRKAEQLAQQIKLKSSGPKPAPGNGPTPGGGN